jgi:hypothetical protein
MMLLMSDNQGQPGDKPEQPAEGAAIQRAMIRERLSARQAAPLAGMSEGRWRQIVSGYQSVGGQHLPVKAPAATLARMAQAVKLTPEDLIDAGRRDAAEVLRDLNSSAPATDKARDETDEALIKVMRSDLSEDQKQKLIRLLTAEKENAERQRVEHAEELIRLFEPGT